MSSPPDRLHLKGKKGSLLHINGKVNYFNHRCFTISDLASVSWAVRRPFNTSTRRMLGSNNSEPGVCNYSNKGFHCTKCFKIYRHRTNLLRHLRLECGKEPNFQCQYCQHRSKRKSNLMLHIRNLHKNYAK